MYILLYRERQSDRQIERERQRQTDRQTDRQRETDRQTDRDRERQREIDREIETERDTHLDTQCTVLIPSILSILYSRAIDSPSSTPVLNDIQLRISDLSVEYDVHTEIGRYVMQLTYKVL